MFVIGDSHTNTASIPQVRQNACTRSLLMVNERSLIGSAQTISPHWHFPKLVPTSIVAPTLISSLSISRAVASHVGSSELDRLGDGEDGGVALATLLSVVFGPIKVNIVARVVHYTQKNVTKCTAGITDGGNG